MQDRVTPGHLAYDEGLAFVAFANILETQPHLAFDREVVKVLTKDRLSYFHQKFPSDSFKFTSEWCQAILNDIDTVLLPALESDSPDQRNLARLMRTMQTFTVAVLEQELAFEERLDAIMDRAIKRLVQSKVAKSIIAKLPEDGRSVQLPATHNRECANSGKAIGKVHRLKAASLSTARPEIGNPTMLPAAV
jgi:hypothetical protein